MRRPQPQTLGLSNSPALSAGVKAAQVAANFIPVVGPAVSMAIAPIVSIFTASHAAAVQKEASTLNATTPSFTTNVALIFQQLNAGQITPTAAISALQSAQSQYYSQVASIIKKGGPCSSSCLIGGAPANTYPQPSQSIGSGLSTSPNCCNSSGTCNAACCIGCSVIEPAVAGLIAIIQAGGGTYTVNPTTQNGSIAATPALTVTYNGSQGTGGVAGMAQSVLGGTTLGVPTWALLAGGGLLLLFAMR